MKKKIESQLKEQEDSLLPGNNSNQYPVKIPSYFSPAENQQGKDEDSQINLFAPPQNEESANRREFVFPDFFPSEQNTNNANNDIFGLTLDNNSNNEVNNPAPIDFLDLGNQTTSDFTNAPINKEDLIIANLGINDKENNDITNENQNENLFNPSFDQIDTVLTKTQKEDTNELKIEIPDVDDEKTEKDQNAKEAAFNPSFDNFDSTNMPNQVENTSELKI